MTTILGLVGLGFVLGISFIVLLFWLFKDRPDEVWYDTIVAFGDPKYPVKVEGFKASFAEACEAVDKQQKDGVEDQFPGNPYAWHKIIKVTHETLEDTSP